MIISRGILGLGDGNHRCSCLTIRETVYLDVPYVSGRDSLSVERVYRPTRDHFFAVGPSSSRELECADQTSNSTSATQCCAPSLEVCSRLDCFDPGEKVTNSASRTSRFTLCAAGPERGPRIAINRDIMTSRSPASCEAVHRNQCATLQLVA